MVFGAARKSRLTEEQVEKVMEGIGEKIVLSDEEFALVVKRLHPKSRAIRAWVSRTSSMSGNEIFNPPDAPVSYPFLWDISYSDYLQWNGVAPNAGPGPLGRNTGEVIGVFGILDWGAIPDTWAHPLRSFKSSACRRC